MTNISYPHNGEPWTNEASKRVLGAARENLKSTGNIADKKGQSARLTALAEQLGRSYRAVYGHGRQLLREEKKSGGLTKKPARPASSREMKMRIPRDQKELLTAFAREAARMSYPGHMNPIVKKGTKKAIECYFTSQFPMERIWAEASTVASQASTYDRWHAERTSEIAKEVELFKKGGNYKSEAIAAKFLNTFMHQLMKFKNCRPLFKHLHLPLDRRVFGKLHSLSSHDNNELGFLSSSHKRKIRRLIDEAPSPYNVSYSGYLQIQNALWPLVKAINEQVNSPILTSRIELNILWL